MRALRLIAWRELADTLHNRWLIGFGGLFAALTMLISYFGLASAHQVGFQGFEQVSASLLNLILFTVPLVAMAQPVMSLTADGDELAVMLTQPLERRDVLLGRYLGTLAALATTLLGGLLLGGLVVLGQAGSDSLGHFALLGGLALVLIALFAALGTAIAVVWNERTRALGIALGVWFLLAIVYDLVVFGLTISNPGVPLKTLLIGALVLNPIDASRVFYLLATGASSFVGVAGAVLGETLGTPLGLAALGLLLLAWPPAILAAAAAVFARRDY